uniref:Uncharacterized protein n=1 Tax=Rhizophora mucronata TaxID=61149 RepID=A0A2P2N4U5_RHIMU
MMDGLTLRFTCLYYLVTKWT